MISKISSEFSGAQNIRHKISTLRACNRVSRTKRQLVFFQGLVASSGFVVLEDVSTCVKAISINSIEYSITREGPRKNCPRGMYKLRCEPSESKTKSCLSCLPCFKSTSGTSETKYLDGSYTEHIFYSAGAEKSVLFSDRQLIEQLNDEVSCNEESVLSVGDKKYDFVKLEDASGYCDVGNYYAHYDFQGQGADQSVVRRFTLKIPIPVGDFKLQTDSLREVVFKSDEVQQMRRMFGLKDFNVPERILVQCEKEEETNISQIGVELEAKRVNFGKFDHVVGRISRKLLLNRPDLWMNLGEYLWTAILEAALLPGEPGDSVEGESDEYEKRLKKHSQTCRNPNEIETSAWDRLFGAADLKESIRTIQEMQVHSCFIFSCMSFMGRVRRGIMGGVKHQIVLLDQPGRQLTYYSQLSSFRRTQLRLGKVNGHSKTSNSQIMGTVKRQTVSRLLPYSRVRLLFKDSTKDMDSGSHRVVELLKMFVSNMKLAVAGEWSQTSPGRLTAVRKLESWLANSNFVHEKVANLATIEETSEE